MRWLERTLLVGVPLLTALGAAVLVFFGLLLVRRLIVQRAAKLAERTPTELDNLLVELARRTRPLLIAVVAVYAGSFALEPPLRVAGALRVAMVLAVVFQAGLWVSAVIDFWVARSRKRLMTQDVTTASLLGVLRFAAKMVLWSVVLLVGLDNLGVDITALIAGLGIGGVAVALALQNVLGDLLASLSIVLDKPFVIGDTITVDTFTGTIENIGLKTTRMRSQSGEQVVFPNGNLLQSRIRNLARLQERRNVLNFGVAYQTPADKIERIPGMVRSIVESQADVRFDRSHFLRLGTASLEFEVVYFILSPDYRLHMDRQQTILLEMIRAFEREGIELAQPAPTVIVQAPQPAGRNGNEAALPRASEA
jgi:small-conductance mechanosensitive channel